MNVSVEDLSNKDSDVLVLHEIPLRLRHINHQNRCYWCTIVNLWWIGTNMDNRLWFFISCDSKLECFATFNASSYDKVYPGNNNSCVSMVFAPDIYLWTLVKTCALRCHVCTWHWEKSVICERWICMVAPHYLVMDSRNLRKDLHHCKRLHTLLLKMHSPPRKISRNYWIWLSWRGLV